MMTIHPFRLVIVLAVTLVGCSPKSGQEQDAVQAGDSSAVTVLPSMQPGKPEPLEFAHGGVVLYTDQTGEHGLVCSISDLSTGTAWMPDWKDKSFDMALGATDESLGDKNTMMIYSKIGRSLTYAAKFCSDLVVEDGNVVYDDWYLPSKEELNLLYKSKTAVDYATVASGSPYLTRGSIWTSTEVSEVKAIAMDFDKGSQSAVEKTGMNVVRAIRAFVPDKNKKNTVGEFTEGGIVFYLDSAARRGLACTKIALSVTAPWRPFPYDYTNPPDDIENVRSTEIPGNEQTRAIVAGFGTFGPIYAARLCDEWENKGKEPYNDWYLPTIEELTLIYQMMPSVDSVAIANGGTPLSREAYWSSTCIQDPEYIEEGGKGSSGPPPVLPVMLQFKDGTRLRNATSDLFHVRAVRLF